MFRIPEHTRKKASRCPFGHACLKAKADFPKCRVDDANGENILFLRDQGEVSCPYLILFADTAVCRCPVHYCIISNNGTEPDRRSNWRIRRLLNPQGCPYCRYFFFQFFTGVFIVFLRVHFGMYTNIKLYFRLSPWRTDWDFCAVVENKLQNIAFW